MKCSVAFFFQLFDNGEMMWLKHISVSSQMDEFLFQDIWMKSELCILFLDDRQSQTRQIIKILQLAYTFVEFLHLLSWSVVFYMHLVSSFLPLLFRAMWRKFCTTIGNLSLNLKLHN